MGVLPDCGMLGSWAMVGFTGLAILAADIPLPLCMCFPYCCNHFDEMLGDWRPFHSHWWCKGVDYVILISCVDFMLSWIGWLYYHGVGTGGGPYCVVGRGVGCCHYVVLCPGMQCAPWAHPAWPTRGMGPHSWMLWRRGSNMTENITTEGR